MKIDDRWGFVDKSGNMVIDSEFAYATCFIEGLARVGVQQPEGILYGFIDTTGDMVIEPQYGNAGPFSEGLSAVPVEVSNK